MSARPGGRHERCTRHDLRMHEAGAGRPTMMCTSSNVTAGRPRFTDQILPVLTAAVRDARGPYPDGLTPCHDLPAVPPPGRPQRPGPRRLRPRPDHSHHRGGARPARLPLHGPEGRVTRTWQPYEVVIAACWKGERALDPFSASWIASAACRSLRGSRSGAPSIRCAGPARRVAEIQRRTDLHRAAFRPAGPADFRTPRCRTPRTRECATRAGRSALHITAGRPGAHDCQRAHPDRAFRMSRRMRSCW